MRKEFEVLIVMLIENLDSIDREDKIDLLYSFYSDVFKTVEKIDEGRWRELENRYFDLQNCMSKIVQDQIDNIKNIEKSKKSFLQMNTILRKRIENEEFVSTTKRYEISSI